MSDPSPPRADLILAQRCLEGDAGAIRQFQDTYRPVLIAYLRKTGAGLDEAEEVTEGLWADCLMERPQHRPRLATYAGQAALKTWLYPLALNRLVARKRRQESWKKLVQEGLHLEEMEGSLAASDMGMVEAPLLDLMREALEAGFRECPAKDFVLLQLAHVDRLRLFELARMFACSTSKIDRDLIRAGKVVAEATLGHVRKVDPWLDLKWEDFVELCRVTSPACFGLD